MKIVYLVVALHFSIVTHSQSINKAFVDNYAKSTSAAFKLENARYFINNTICDAGELNEVLRNWSVKSVASISVYRNEDISDFFFAPPESWIVCITGTEDLEKATIRTKCFRKKKKEKQITNQNCNEQIK